MLNNVRFTLDAETAAQWYIALLFTLMHTTPSISLIQRSNHIVHLDTTTNPLCLFSLALYPFVCYTQNPTLVLSSRSQPTTKLQFCVCVRFIPLALRNKTLAIMTSTNLMKFVIVRYFIYNNGKKSSCIAWSPPRECLSVRSDRQWSPH